MSEHAGEQGARLGAVAHHAHCLVSSIRTWANHVIYRMQSELRDERPPRLLQSVHSLQACGRDSSGKRVNTGRRWCKAVLHVNREAIRACRAAHEAIQDGDTNVDTNAEPTPARTAIDATRARELLRKPQAHVQIAGLAGELCGASAARTFVK